MTRNASDIHSKAAHATFHAIPSSSGTRRHQVRTRKFIFGFLSFVALAAHAQEDFGSTAMLNREKKTSAIDHYEGSVQFAMFMCSTARSMNGSLAELQEMGKQPDEAALAKADYRVCIQKNGASLKKVYESAAASLKGNAAKAALREHFIQATISLEGISPNSQDVKLLYAKRQNDNETKLNELWTRFKLSR